MLHIGVTPGCKLERFKRVLELQGVLPGEFKGARPNPTLSPLQPSIVNFSTFILKDWLGRCIFAKIS